MRHHRPILLLLALAVLAAGEAPYGSKDFHPSPEQPVGWRGDGSGAFPGATPVQEWWSGTPGQRDATLRDRHGREKETRLWDTAADGARNIVWKAPLPAWSLAAPIVLGDRVVSVCETHVVVCHDAATGSELWRRNLLPLLFDGVGEPQARAVQEVLDVADAVHTLYWHASEKNAHGIYTADDGAAMAGVLSRNMEAWRATVAARAADLLPAFDAARDAALRRFQVSEKKEVKPLQQTLRDFVEATERKWQVPIGNTWLGYVGQATNPPCSDGRHIYVAFTQGQVACLDLDGQVVWGYRQREWEKPKRDNFCLNPLLVDGLYIVKNTTNRHYVAYDCRNGREVWRVPRKGGQYTQPLLLRLPTPGGRSLAVLVMPGGREVVRVADGKPVATFPYEGGDGRGHALVGHGDLFATGTSGDNYSGPGSVYRLVADDAGGVTVQHLHDLASKPLSMGGLPLGHDGWLFGRIEGKSRKGLIDLASGTVRAQFDLRWDGSAPVLAGRFLIAIDSASGGNSPWDRPRDDRKAMIACSVVDLAAADGPRVVAANNLLAEPGPAADLVIPRLFAGIDPLHFAGNDHGCASYFGGQMFGVVPSGNRLFLQSVAHLWCIGDPAVPYDWNPASRERQR